ncbi:MFS transporter [Actinotalea sp. Marseille-Q4924]|uniref:MFS transporter n=1 Tax=Actinotalea sp. Marseille-Q4924 TaxID=2866571 RepID=UPI001CE430EC|nr:MFS transporter [Actinotalea sp. Marseille-Q4924]
MSTTPPRTARRRSSLAFHRDFRQLWAGDAFGQFGAQLTGLVLPIYAVTALQATPWQMGALTAAETAAFLVIGLPAGAWVDRMRKRRTLVVADVVRAAALAVVVAAAATGSVSIPLLIAAALVISGATVFFDVAHQSYVPGLVGLDHVVEGNAKLQATQSVAMVVAPAVGGALLRVISAPALIATTVGTYLLSAAFLGRIRHEETLPRREDRRPLRTEIAEGLQFVVRQPLLRRMVACTSLSNLAGSIGGALMVIYALRVLGLDAAALGLVFSLSAAGGLLGAVAAERMARWIGEARVIPVSAVAGGLTFVLNPLAAVLADVVPAAAVLVVAGFGFSFWVVVYNVAQVSFRQRLCPPALLGRMNASVRFIVWGTMPIGGLLGGWLGTAVGVTTSLWISAIGMTLGSLPVVLSPLRYLTELPRPGAEPSA